MVEIHVTQRREEERAAGPRLVLSRELAARLQGHAEANYPEEACGGLLGRAEGDVIEVVATTPLPNTREDERHRRYLVGPDEVRRLERRSSAAGLEVVGYYHSHPDAPAVPSAYDREHAWTWYIYLIIGVRDGNADDIRAWQLSDDRVQFNRVPISEDKPWNG